MNVPNYLWEKAVLSASYLINRMPTCILKYSTPLECFKIFFAFSQVHLDLSLKVFGSTVFVHIPSHSWSKLDPRAAKCIFIGYAPNKKGYKFYNPQTKKFFVSMNVSWMENKPYFHQKSLKGEKESIEDNFLDLSPVPLPNIILNSTPTTHTSPSPNPTVFEKQSEESLDKTFENPSTKLPDIDVSSTGGETLQKDQRNQNTEFLVYSRRRHCQKN